MQLLGRAKSGRTGVALMPSYFGFLMLGSNRRDIVENDRLEEVLALRNLS